MDDKWPNAVERINKNVADKWVEIANEIDEFTKQKLVEMEMFIHDHNDGFYEDESVCPACGHTLDVWDDSVIKLSPI